MIVLPYHASGYDVCFSEVLRKGIMGRNGEAKEHLLIVALSLCKPQLSTSLQNE